MVIQGLVAELLHHPRPLGLKGQVSGPVRSFRLTESVGKSSFRKALSGGLRFEMHGISPNVPSALPPQSYKQREKSHVIASKPKGPQLSRESTQKVNKIY